jgi:lysophospholipase L1-like esterase
MFKRQVDLRSEPVKRVVALGESSTWGYSVSKKEHCWVNRTVSLLEEFQGESIELINQGIGSNVITPNCPAYEASAKPSGLERLDDEVIALKPDLLFVSYGLNDSRGGTTTKEFRRAFQELIDRVHATINPLIVAPNLYYMREVLYADKPWHHSNYEVSDVFNLIVKQLCEQNDLIYVDIYGAEVGADWVIDEDQGHPSDLGHRLIAHRVFEAIARNCSFVARTTPKETLISHFYETYGNGPERPYTGGDTKDALLKEE